MARKPAKPALQKFATSLARYFTGAAAPAVPRQNLWSYATFAKESAEFDERTVSTWCKGTSLARPAKIGKILDLLSNAGLTSGARKELEELYWAAADEATALLKQPKLDKARAIWVARGPVLAWDRAAKASDIRVARDPAQQHLQTLISDLAKEIASETKRPSYNSDLLKELSAAAANFRSLIDCDPAKVPERLRSLFFWSTRLGGLLETDGNVRVDHTDESLSAGVRGRLADLVRNGAAWLYAFPLVRTMDSDAAKPSGGMTARVAPSVPFVQCLLDRGTIDALDGDTLSKELFGAGDVIRRGGKIGAQGLKTIAIASGDATNLLLAALREVTIANLDGFLKDEIDGTRIREIGQALVDAGSSVMAIAATMGPDIQQAVITVLDICRNPRPHRFSFRDAPPGLPSWANESGQDKYGYWASFSLSTPDGPPVVQRLRWIAPGRFWMGSPHDDPEAFPSERTRREVEIKQGFWLFDTPCTQALWQAVMGNNPSAFQDPQRPVEHVSFRDVRKFLEKINARIAGLALSLPSEARWEYACRAGTETERYQSDLDAIAWYAENSGDGFDPNELAPAGRGAKSPERIETGTMRVAKKTANDWGLYDMLGNVWEWCADTWHDSYDGAPDDGSAWLEPDARARNAARRVVRGGSWDNDARFVRAACRARLDPDARVVNLGFRCARVQSD